MLIPHHHVITRSDSVHPDFAVFAVDQSEEEKFTVCMKAINSSFVRNLLYVSVRKTKKVAAEEKS
jgi:hypothetical protein